MREIKFRAFDRVTNKIIYPENSTGWKLHFNGSVDYEGSWASGDLLLEQFTGLQDKNGVDIYEGDIVIHHVESEFLEREDWAVIESKVLIIDGAWCVGLSKYPLYGFLNVVVGNIHENKDLI